LCSGASKCTNMRRIAVARIALVPVSKPRCSLPEYPPVSKHRMGSVTSSLCSVIFADRIVLIKSDFSTNGISLAIPYASMYSRSERTDIVVSI
jgi:hypothetical protein